MSKELYDLLAGKRPVPKKLTAKDVLSTGSAVLNLAMTGMVAGGVAKGTYLFLVGDSSTGKTWVAFTLFAEAAISRAFRDYRFIFDNAENGAYMDVERFFGPDVVKRLEPPSYDKHKEPNNSSTIEEFYYHIDDAFEIGRPFVYVLDSMDALDTEDEEDKFAKDKELHAKGKEGTGSYGTEKARANSRNMRRVVRRLADTGSILVVLSQTKDKIGGYGGRTRAGGRSLTFYAHHEIWTAVRERMKNKYDRVVGTEIVAKIAKNRLTGWEGEVFYTFLKNHGIDDLGTCVNFLVGAKHWSETKGVVTAPEFEFSGRREKFIRKVEKEGLEMDLHDIVAEVWTTIEEESVIRRKSRYH